MGSSREDFLRSEAMCLAHDRNEKSHESWFSLVRPSCEIPAKHSVLLFWHICSTVSSPILYIYHHYSHIVRSAF